MRNGNLVHVGNSRRTNVKVDALRHTYIGFGQRRCQGGAQVIGVCAESVVLTRPISVTAPAKIFGTGKALYGRNDSNLTTGQLVVELRNATDTLVASSSSAFVTSSGGDIIPISIAEVLHAGSAVFGGFDYIAAPGIYTLGLKASTTNGSCAGSPIFYRPALSFLLVGAK